MPAKEYSLGLMRAAEAGDADQVSECLARGADPLCGNSRAIRMAALEGHVECVKLLIPASNPKANNSYVLCWAASNGHIECLRLLAPRSGSKVDNSRALRCAAAGGHAECVKILIPISNPKDNRLALKDAIDSQSVECVRLLIPESGPLLNDRKVLASALARGNAKILSLMLAREPLLLTGLDLRRHRDAAIANWRPELAMILSAIIEQQALVADVHSPAPCPAPSARRL